MTVPPPKDDERSERVGDLYAEFRLRQDDGEALDLDIFVKEHPVFADDLRELDRNERQLSKMSGVFGLGNASIDPVGGTMSALPEGRDTPEGRDVVHGTDKVRPAGPVVEQGERRRSAPRRTRDMIEHIATRQSAFTRYSIERKVGQGSMGEVFRVWDQDLRRTLAMKVLSRGFGRLNTDQYERTLARFVAEAQVTSQLDHPSIVPVHEFGVTGEGQAYFTMKLVKGRELLSIIDSMHDPADAPGESGWSLHRVVALIHRVCEAMAYAHHKGVLHRDLKPTNIMVGRYGAVYVMDWGLARILGSDHPDVLLAGGDVTFRVTSDRDSLMREAGDDHDRTRKGASVGTPAYMSPEQASGRNESVDERADIYGIGAILYHVVAGHAPYTEPGKRTAVEAVLFRLQQGPPTPVDSLVPDAPPELRAIIRSAMARAPGTRFQTMEQLADELAAFLEGRSNAEAQPSKASGKRKVAMGAGIAVAILAAGAIGYLIGS